MRQLIYTGFINEKCFGENNEALFIGNMKEPLAREFEENIQGANVSVRYWISDVEKSKEQLQEGALLKIIGAVDAKYNVHYSDITGYLWTDEELKIGGHNLLRELSNNKNKFIYLEIDIHN